MSLEDLAMPRADAKQLDVITIGRASVDLCGQQIAARRRYGSVRAERALCAGHQAGLVEAGAAVFGFGMAGDRKGDREERSMVPRRCPARARGASEGAGSGLRGYSGVFGRQGLRGRADLVPPTPHPLRTGEVKTLE